MTTATTTSEKTAYRAFFEEHCRLNEVKDIEGLANHYTEDAAILSIDAQSYGRDAIHSFFQTVLTPDMNIALLSIDRFVETQDAIIAQTQVGFDSGVAAMSEHILMRDGLIYRHFFGQLGFTPKA